MEPVGAKTPYDALMDNFEPKMSAENVSSVFSDLRTRLVPLVKKYSDICRDVPDDFLSRKVPSHLVEDVSRRVPSQQGWRPRRQRNQYLAAGGRYGDGVDHISIDEAKLGGCRKHRCLHLDKVERL